MKSGNEGLCHETIRHNQSDPSQESRHEVSSQSHPKWWDWCADPKLEAGILLLATLTALITWGLTEH